MYFPNSKEDNKQNFKVFISVLIFSKTGKQYFIFLVYENVYVTPS